MKKFEASALKGLAYSASALAMVVAAPALAQDADVDCDNLDPSLPVPAECEADITGADGTTGGDAGIVVTGSRIVRDTYTSTSPLQVLTSETENEAGLFDPSQILQRSESASGTQIDATFQGFVLDNGPGSQTLNLRGLGADRTLLMVNGRRLAPAGVEGAPTNPSINLLPGSLIERYDLLLDGASSIYGSDAVAGVGNIILKKDFDGLELFARGEINPEGAGEDYTISGAWGINTDRAFFGIGAEYDYRDAIRLRDRDFFQGCDRHYEIDQNGNILTVGKADNAAVLSASGGLVSVSENACKQGGISGRIFQPYARFGSVYFPANGNIANFPNDPNTGRPFNFGDSTNAFGQHLDTNGDGVRDVDFQNVNTNGADDSIVFLSEQKLINVMAYGEYTFPGAANITPFFEIGYSRAEIFADNTGAPQVFPSVPDLNQFNPCNFVTNPDGVDCRAVDNELNGISGTSLALSTGFPLPTTPIASIQGDRDNTDVTQEQYRGVFGIKGDLPFISPSWTFETSLTYSKSKGRSVRRGIREDKLALALGLDPTADYDGDGIVDNDGDGIADDYDNNLDVFGFFGDPQWIGECNTAGLANPSLAAADLLQGCVPVNLFAPSVLGAPVGTLATQAEADYIFGLRTFDTEYEQITGAAYITGDLFELPAGPVGAVFGVEYRNDKIDSQPDFVASNGLFFGFFSDQGAKGSKWIREAFGEIDIPLQAGKPWVQELNLNLSGRVTDEEFYGTNFTYAVKGNWRPIEPLLFKISYGTSFRAPNLRENFLRGQSGFLTLFDPCAVPTNAFNGLAGGYDATLDQRDPAILANCAREGRDPTRVGVDGVNALNTQQTSSVEITTGGSLDIDPETSRSLTAGFAFEETIGDGWDVSLGFNYYDIKIKDAIVEPSSQFIVNDCFTRQDGTRSPFCDRIEYDIDPTSRLLVSAVNSGFINLNQESVRGMDFNATFGKEVQAFGTLVDLGLNFRANHLIERSTIFVDDLGVRSYDDDAGEFGLPKWTGRATFTADIDNFRFTWQTRYTGPVEQDADGIDPLSDAFGNGPDGNPTGFVGDTCTGGGSANGVVTGDGIYCRDVGFADEQFLHTASLRYRTDRYTFLIGVDNIFNTAPPLVDSNEVFAIANTAIGNGYDYDGREFFASVSVEF
ncbi:MAG: TonB-dependent receptor [Sphingomonadaceae bacterium]|nr:TonB-dependent receptor [Altererythrobacter sp.]MCP5391386.1 TonB-dependent receptor [Sphingomonadaceae bacterium]MCP5393615.1 TonB-dependent receptor [Sphingomonadaceae bacterium]